MIDTNSLQDKDYLGDGVYVGHDGYHIILWLDDGGPPGRPIALEPSVMNALDRYRNRVRKGIES